MGMGNATFAANNTDGAISAYEKAYGLLPTDADRQNNLAWAYATKGINLKKADALVKNALKAANKYLTDLAIRNIVDYIRDLEERDAK